MGHETPRKRLILVRLAGMLRRVRTIVAANGNLFSHKMLKD